MQKKALIILAEGFEEIEAVTPIDLLSRAGVDVLIAGLTSCTVTGAHSRLSVQCERLVDAVPDEFDALILPGGMPGARNLAESRALKKLIQTMAAAGKIIAAICASPALVLAPIGILDGKKATCYPSMETAFPASCTHSSDPVVIDGNVITSQGPGTAFPFSLAIIEELVSHEKRAEIERATLVTIGCGKETA